MSDLSDMELGREDARRVALAEYVLGQGTATSRAAIARAIETDPAIAAEARFWEAHFSRFNEDYEEMAAPAHLFANVEKRLFGDAKTAQNSSWFNALGFWRAMTGLAAAVAVVAIALNIMPLTTDQPPADTTELIAALQPAEGDMSLLARYDREMGQLHLNGAGAPAGEGSDYELWFIEGENAPISMGVLSMGEPQTLVVAEELRAQFGEGITLAVSRETAGGSPTGAPQGPIMAAGAVAAI